MKTTKISKGFYKVQTQKQTFQIVSYNTDVKEPIFWMVQTLNQLGNFHDIDIEFNTKKDALNYIINNL